MDHDVLLLFPLGVSLVNTRRAASDEIIADLNRL